MRKSCTNVHAYNFLVTHTVSYRENMYCIFTQSMAFPVPYYDRNDPKLDGKSEAWGHNSQGTRRQLYTHSYTHLQTYIHTHTRYTPPIPILPIFKPPKFPYFDPQ